ncbi:hypothetical protein ASE01_19300 [Nocardioides sp. Root190]|uniref:LPXTG cell wall anchor domain-containing protein n=1 Tax=Nocardioides sp. Root190 TaxID=1736488 RepID=UPI0006FE0D55|nr:LPXTG cell wall anchor domain-containing protein [Nocardioides sp. Root190]KRB74131.1 hypothetical protein ASE01_19300 [Nocardioides sp. Root190]
MIRRLASLVASAVLAVGVAAAPAHADGEIGLSNDGTTWGDQLATPLFDPSFIWVPGDVEERSFFVRNDGPSAAELTVDVVAADPDTLLADDDFLVEARLGNGAWVNIEDGTTSLRSTSLDVAEGVSTTVTLRGTFRPESTRENGIIPLRATITLSEDGDVGGVDDGDGDGDGNVGGVDNGGLPDTGSPVDMILVWLAAGLIGGGLALVRTRRRESEEVARA